MQAQAFALPRPAMDAQPPRKPAFDIGSNAETLPVSESVLLLVDYINPLEFEDAGPLRRAALESARVTAEFKDALADAGIPAIYANDNYGIWHSEFGDVLAYCASLPDEAGEIASLLAPAPDDLTILKPRHSGFYATPLELLLAQMQARRVIIVGLAADLCVQITAMDAHLRGYRVWVPPDCTAAETAARKDAAIEYLGAVLGCDVSPAQGWQAPGDGAADVGRRAPDADR